MPGILEVAEGITGKLNLACNDLLVLMPCPVPVLLVVSVLLSLPDPSLLECRDRPGLTSRETRLACAEIVMAAAEGGSGMVRREGGILLGRTSRIVVSTGLANWRGLGSFRADMGARSRDR